MAADGLGPQLRAVRDIKGLSLGAVAKQAGISAAYLQKLERGEVRNPSPHVLYKLAEALDLPYPDLMRLAGYVVPGEERESGRDRAGSLLAHAFSSEDLTEEELAALARYLAWYRHDRATRGGASDAGRPGER